MLFQNASPQDIKRQLATDLNISRAQSERLFRTETSRFFSEASHDTYRAAGITTFEFMSEADACDQCQSLDGKVYRITDATPVPVHPNCRCAILPIVKDIE
jgi:SPP1 gp7 family putative phage head morphogenesis protein